MNFKMFFEAYGKNLRMKRGGAIKVGDVISGPSDVPMEVINVEEAPETRHPQVTFSNGVTWNLKWGQLYSYHGNVNNKRGRNIKVLHNPFKD